jgi:hypothetical protein
MPKTTPETHVTDLVALEAELRPLSSDKLQAIFLECFRGAADFIAKAALCVKLMKERGEPIAGFPHAGRYLKIASGQILPELAAAFAQSPNLRRAENLPLDQQRELVEKPMRPVIEPAPTGGYTTRMYDLRDASAEIGKQVIGPDGLRNPEEQLAAIEVPKRRALSRPVAPTESANEPLTHSITVKLTAQELVNLRNQATLAGIKEAEMARRGLLRSGVLK